MADAAQHVGTDLERLTSALGAAGYQAYSNTLVGNQAPSVRAYYGRVRAPRVGDIVVEASTFTWRDRKGYGHVAVGTLVEHKVERLVYEEDDLDPQPYDEEAWYVRPLAGGDVVRWTNADFIAVPRSRDEGAEWGKS